MQGIQKSKSSPLVKQIGWGLVLIGMCLIFSYQTNSSIPSNPNQASGVTNSLSTSMVIFFTAVSFFYSHIRKQEADTNLLEAENRALKEALNQANQELDTFLYKASHDLKGPITTLEGVCNIGLVDSQDETARAYFNMQKEVIHKMQLLLFRIVEIGDLRNHKTSFTAVNMSRFFRGIIRSMNRVEGFEREKFSVEVDSDLHIHTDVEMLEIAVDNLVKNAIQHANHFKQEQAQVRISAWETDHTYEIRVEDNGEGIPPKMASRIFEMFFRGHDFFKGFGLGLYRAQIAATKLRADLSLLHSSPQGSSFGLSIPKSEMPEIKKEK